MKKYTYLTLAFLFSLTAPLVAHAATSVNITSEGDSHSEVNIKNSFNSTNNSTTTSKSSVTITTNGKTQHYESNNGEDINIKSDDGSSEVKIQNNGSVKGSSVSATPKPTETPHKENKETKRSKNIFQIIRDFFKSLFS